MGPGAMILVFWMLSFKPAFSLSIKGFPDSSAGKESTFNVENLDLVPVLGRYSGERKGYPLQYFALENSMDCYSPGGCRESDMTEWLSLCTVLFYPHQEALHFLPLVWYHLHIWGVGISLRNLDSSLWFTQPNILHDVYSASKLNKWGDSIQPWCSPFPILNQSIVPCPVLTVSSWPEYRFLRRQVRWSGILISLRIFHSLLWSTQSKAIV